MIVGGSLTPGGERSSHDHAASGADQEIPEQAMLVFLVVEKPVSRR